MNSLTVKFDDFFVAIRASIMRHKFAMHLTFTVHILHASFVFRSIRFQYDSIMSHQSQLRDEKKAKEKNSFCLLLTRGFPDVKAFNLGRKINIKCIIKEIMQRPKSLMDDKAAGK